ncbi:MAG: zinc ribbon domain-containing protein [Chloroflexota bacterium]
MDVGSILLLLAMVVLVAGFIFRPFRDGGPDVWEEDIELSELLSERERILDALVELDFDNELGKVPEEIYLPQRKYLLATGAEVIKKLEEDYQADAEDLAIEAQIAARRSKIEEIIDEDDPLEKMISKRRKSASPKKQAAKGSSKAKFCAECGSAIKPGDQFCTSCGSKL